MLKCVVQWLGHLFLEPPWWVLRHGTMTLLIPVIEKWCSVKPSKMQFIRSLLAKSHSAQAIKTKKTKPKKPLLLIWDFQSSTTQRAAKTITGVFLFPLTQGDVMNTVCVSKYVSPTRNKIWSTPKQTTCTAYWNSITQQVIYLWRIKCQCILQQCLCVGA